MGGNKALFKDHLNLKPVSLLTDGRVRKEKERSAQKKTIILCMSSFQWKFLFSYTLQNMNCIVKSVLFSCVFSVPTDFLRQRESKQNQRKVWMALWDD